MVFRVLADFANPAVPQILPTTTDDFSNTHMKPSKTTSSEQGFWALPKDVFGAGVVNQKLAEGKAWLGGHANNELEAAGGPPIYIMLLSLPAHGGLWRHQSFGTLRTSLSAAVAGRPDWSPSKKCSAWSVLPRKKKNPEKSGRKTHRTVAPVLYESASSEHVKTTSSGILTLVQLSKERGACESARNHNQAHSSPPKWPRSTSSPNESKLKLTLQAQVSSCFRRGPRSHPPQRIRSPH